MESWQWTKWRTDSLETIVDKEEVPISYKPILAMIDGEVRNEILSIALVLSCYQMSSITSM